MQELALVVRAVPALEERADLMLTLSLLSVVRIISLTLVARRVVLVVVLTLHMNVGGGGKFWGFWLVRSGV